MNPCWTLADARQIMESAKPGARVLLMGAGFIGCIIMEALATRGVQLSVVEMRDRMVPRMMGEGAGGMIKRWVEKKGITVYTSTRVESIQAGAPLTVRLSNGKELAVDLVISAAGVQPNIGFLESSGIKFLQGVLTDERMQTNVPGVYAAGDCAEAFDVITGTSIVSAIQPNAADQAYCAGMNMAGKNSALNGVTQINVLDNLGLISTSFGRWEGVPGGEHAELSDEANFRYIRLEFDGDVLAGYNAIGLTDHIGFLRGLTQSRVKLGAWKDRLLRDPLRIPEAYLASAQAQHAAGNADRLRTRVGSTICRKAERGRGHHRQAVRHAERLPSARAQRQGARLQRASDRSGGGHHRADGDRAIPCAASDGSPGAGERHLRPSGGARDSPVALRRCAGRVASHCGRIGAGARAVAIAS